MIKAGMAAVCAVLVSSTVPADACGWKRDGLGWRSAGYGYSDGYRYRGGWGYRSYRPWVGAGYGWRGDGYRWGRRGYGYRPGIGVGFRDRGWGDRRHWRGDGYGWRGERMERRSLFRDRRVDADVVAK